MAGCEHFVFKYVEILILSSVTYCSFKGLQLTRVSAEVIGCSFSVHFMNHHFNETVSGGAIAAYYSNVSIFDSIFEANYAEQGGAILLDSESNIKLLNCTFVRNQGNNGGVIYSGRKNNLVVYNSSFIDNKVGGGDYSQTYHNGGVLYLYETSVIIVYL